MHKTMNFRRVVGAGLAIAMGMSVSLAATAAMADEKIRILCPTWSGFAPVFVAQELGYFKNLGIEVDIKFEDERANVMAAMEHGDIEMDMRTVGEYQGKPRDAKTPGIIIGAIDQSLGGDGVIASGDITSVEQLKGKTVASEPNIPARLLLQMELKKKGLTLADLDLKQIATADTVAVFNDPSIAAVVSYQPNLSQAIDKVPQRKPHILVSSAQYPGIVIDVITARQDDLKANPEKYKKFMIGIFKAVDYFKTNKADFIKLAAPHFNLTPEEFAESIEGSLEYTGLKETSEYLGKPGAPGTLFKIFDEVMQLNIENGAADNTLKADEQIDNSIVASITEADLK
ncbi:ABC transporter substrate-binding protein [Hyphomicrobium sp.]|uniref:ABC transporter substrate-binding protein n=1 Tax=Hyphomicrobium sp. TaxID=82 RepID=UPI002D771AAF|nr:ABC transporter substrate-binding protein [Hyphomicrobium sp.]HET6388424.1 ABC transporter substrate-binding protein [Hyphomicrobium sp.]